MTVPAEPVAIFKKRGDKTKANIRKREPTPPQAGNSDSDSDFSSSEDDAGHRVKRRRKNTAIVAASSKENVTKGRNWAVEAAEVDRAVPITDSNDATKHTNWFDKDDEDKSNASKPKRVNDGEAAPGVYKGLANQTSYIQKNPDRQSRTVGPVKAPTNIRTVTVTDYAPDVCKDYKNTGFCGYGDNCKFLHAREDYKQGWQLDKEWETVTQGKKNLGGTIVASANRDKKTEDEDNDEEVPEDIPFACIICNGPYKSPVVTRCGHYFCESCALQRYRRDPSCAACGSGTNGVFNASKKLQKLLEKKGIAEPKSRFKSSGFKQSGFKPGLLVEAEPATRNAQEGQAEEAAGQSDVVDVD
jgi:RING finger protein 113A